MTDPTDPLHITDKERLLQLMAQKRKGQARVINEEEMRAALRRRVRGQDHIINHLSNFIRLQWGKERRDKPIASLLFVGPPATGKTELAKAMAEFLFDDDKNMLHFDGSELSGPEGKTRLIGVPPFYVGASEGGQLTKPMLANPKRLVLFDEIEKAFAGIYDLFLSIMGDGRLLEQSTNQVADFTQAVIVLTSNAQHAAISALVNQIDDPLELAKAVRAVLRNAGTFRPELISRLDQIYVFRPLVGEVNAEIAALKIAKAAKQYGVELAFIEPLLVYQLMEQGDIAEDTREMTRIVDSMLGELLIQAKQQGIKRLRILVDDQGKPFVDRTVEP